MRSFLRLLLVCCLAFALPVQGMSAATTALCAADADDPTGADRASHLHEHADAVDDEDDDSMDCATAAVHVEGADAQVSEAHASDAQHAHAGHSLGGKTGAHKCSACASCGVAASLPSTVVSFDAIDVSESFVAVVTGGFATRVSRGLERPPRFFLA